MAVTFQLKNLTLSMRLMVVVLDLEKEDSNYMLYIFILLHRITKVFKWVWFVRRYSSNYILIFPYVHLSFYPSIYTFINISIHPSIYPLILLIYPYYRIIFSYYNLPHSNNDGIHYSKTIFI